MQRVSDERLAEWCADVEAVTFTPKSDVFRAYLDLRDLRAAHAALVEDHARMKAALEMFRDYTPSEVVMDEFAYKRLVGNMHDSAKRALSPLAKEVQP